MTKINPPVQPNLFDEPTDRDVEVCHDCDGVGICCDARWPAPCPRCDGTGYERVPEVV